MRSTVMRLFTFLENNWYAQYKKEHEVEMKWFILKSLDK